MYTKDTDSCIFQEICSLSHDLTAIASMTSFCQQNIQKRPRFYTTTAAPSQLYTFYVFCGVNSSTNAYYSRNHPRDYAGEFADLIKSEHLGTVYQAGPRKNLAYHPNNMSSVYIWTPDRDALDTWWASHAPPPVEPPVPAKFVSDPSVLRPAPAQPRPPVDRLAAPARVPFAQLGQNDLRVDFNWGAQNQAIANPRPPQQGRAGRMEGVFVQLEDVERANQEGNLGRLEGARYLVRGDEYEVRGGLIHRVNERDRLMPPPPIYAAFVDYLDNNINDEEDDIDDEAEDEPEYEDLDDDRGGL